MKTFYLRNNSDPLWRGRNFISQTVIKEIGRKKDIGKKVQIKYI